ncbi:TIGR03643 family protein [Undibacterium sp. Di24W]
MPQIDQAIVDRVIQMAWEDRTTFNAIQRQFGLDESAVIRLMRRAMKASSFRMWRARVTGRKTKHQALRGSKVSRFKSSDQKNRDF